jgi:glutamine synthetase
LPRTLEAAITLFNDSQIARAWFGDDFVDDYVTMRRWETLRYQSTVTEWERERYFEML